MSEDLEVIQCVFAGLHAVALTRDRATGVLHLVQTSARRVWRDELHGIAQVFRTDPLDDTPHWLLAGEVGSESGLSSDFATLVLVGSTAQPVVVDLRPPAFVIALEPEAGTPALCCGSSAPMASRCTRHVRCGGCAIASAAAPNSLPRGAAAAGLPTCRCRATSADHPGEHAAGDAQHLTVHVVAPRRA